MYEKRLEGYSKHPRNFDVPKESSKKSPIRNKRKLKDIISALVATALITGAGYFSYKLFTHPNFDDFSYFAHPSSYSFDKELRKKPTSEH